MRPQQSSCPLQMSTNCAHSNLPAQKRFDRERSGAGRRKREARAENGATPKGLKFGGKKPHQVARRNERERKRVQHLNTGYETLASKLSTSCKAFCDKKLTKAQTLKAAIMYIRHLERVLRSENSAASAGGREEQDSFERRCAAMAREEEEETGAAMDEGEEEEEEHLKSSTSSPSCSQLPSLCAPSSSFHFSSSSSISSSSSYSSSSASSSYSSQHALPPLPFSPVCPPHSSFPSPVYYSPYPHQQQQQQQQVHFVHHHQQHYM